MNTPLPAGLVWRERGRLAWCAYCTAVVPCSNDKLLKQHLRSKTHRKRVGNTPLILRQSEQPVNSAAKQQINSCKVAPQDYQQNHLEALHLAGTYPEDDPSSFLYYTVTSCTCAVPSDAPSAANNTARVLQPGFKAMYAVADDEERICQQLRGCDLAAATNHSICLATSMSDTEQHQQHPALEIKHQHHLQETCFQQHRRLCWPLPFAMRPKAALAAGAPFITLQSGSIPWAPNNFEEALQHYCQPGTCRLPNIDIAGVNQQVKSWSHAAKLLRAAAAGRPGPYTTKQSTSHHNVHLSDRDSCTLEAPGYVHAARQAQHSSGAIPSWASFVADISHPSWWPKTGHVPTYDNVIIGSGPSGIGIHHDVDHSAGDDPPPVSTYLTVVRGKKHMIVMPPDQTLFPVDDKIPFPVDASPRLVHAVKAAGGAYSRLK